MPASVRSCQLLFQEVELLPSAPKYNRSYQPQSKKEGAMRTEQSLAVAILLSMSLLSSQEAQSSQADSTMAEDVESVISAWDSAMKALDIPGVMKHLAARATVQTQGCGKEPERHSRQEFQEMLELVFPHLQSYELERSNGEVKQLGQGSMAIFTSELSEVAVLNDEAPDAQRSTEKYYLDKIGGRYLITSIKTRSHCP